MKRMYIALDSYLKKTEPTFVSSIVFNRLSTISYCV